MIVEKYENWLIFRRGLIKQFCPMKKGSHDLLRPVVPPTPIRSDELPAEYILKHRDSDYQFTQEFEVILLFAFNFCVFSFPFPII